MLAFFSVKPTNLSVQPPEAVGGRIYALMTVLKGQTEIEMLALNSKESFEDNKRYYRERAAMEKLPVISRLLEADARSLDRLQVQMATAREFFVLIRFRDDQDADFRTQLSRVQKSLEDQGLIVIRYYLALRGGRERCDRNGHAVFLRPEVDFATTGSEITGISTSSTKLK